MRKADLFVSYELLRVIPAVAGEATIIMISRATTSYNNNKRCLCSSFVSFDTLLSHKKHPNFLRIVQRRKEVFTVHTNQLLLLLWYSRSFRQQSVLVYHATQITHLEFIFYAFNKKVFFLTPLWKLDRMPGKSLTYIRTWMEGGKCLKNTISYYIIRDKKNIFFK